MFCGASYPEHSDQPPLKNVCLYKEDTQVVSPDVSFDVDSFLGFVTSLGVTRNGLFYQPSPQARQNITIDVHFGLDISRTGSDTIQLARSSFPLLRDVPHFHFGRLVGARERCNICILSTPRGFTWNVNIE
jgi:hypothetical protein